MKTLKTSMIIGAFFVLVTGTLAHFLYDWSGENPIVGLFTPVNESIWEHMKLLFFPMLLYSAVLVLRFKDKEPCMMCSLCFGNLLGTFLIPVLYYTYTAVLHRDFFVLDIATFLISTVAAFYAAYRLTQSCRLQSYATLIYALTAVLFFCFMLFTYDPPSLGLFNDPEIHTFSLHSVEI